MITCGHLKCSLSVLSALSKKMVMFSYNQPNGLLILFQKHGTVVYEEKNMTQRPYIRINLSSGVNLFFLSMSLCMEWQVIHTKGLFCHCKLMTHNKRIFYDISGQFSCTLFRGVATITPNSLSPFAYGESNPICNIQDKRKLVS